MFEWFKLAEDKDFSLEALTAGDKDNLVVLQNSTCIFAFGDGKIGTYPHNFEDGQPLQKIVEASCQVQGLACQVSENLGVTDKSHSKLVAYGQAFACDLCPQAVLYPLTWYDLVSDLLLFLVPQCLGLN